MARCDRKGRHATGFINVNKLRINAVMIVSISQLTLTIPDIVHSTIYNCYLNMMLGPYELGYIEQTRE